MTSRQSNMKNITKSENKTRSENNTRASVQQKEPAEKKNPVKIPKELLKEIKESFDYFDVDRNGYLLEQDFKMAVNFCIRAEVDKNEIKKLMSEYGNNSGKITLDGFKNVVYNKTVK